MQKVLLLVVIIISLISPAFSQNVGIGTSSVTRAKLVVSGTAGGNSRTVGLLGTNAGISLQENWPGIGFNEYKPDFSTIGHSISSGYGMHMNFNFTNGDFLMYRSGYASVGQRFPANDQFLAFTQSTNTLKLNTQIPNGRVEVANKLFAAQSGNFNMVPLGAIYVSLGHNLIGAPGWTTFASNHSGSLMSSYVQTSVNNTLSVQLYLNPAVTSGATNIIVVPALSYINTNGGPIISMTQSVETNASNQMYISLSVRYELISLAAMKGHLIVYGLY